VCWHVENHGVDPDIEVDITPAQATLNQDPQLETGIEQVLKIIEEKAPELCPTTPPEPGPNLASPLASEKPHRRIG